ncbi:MAG: pyruvate kinase [Candidatus Methanogaster sp.]|uniref:Pyruvate kinase n=1 Tax=Candidatus Methanogaster sp. TaxID=3386292 RepID=A0AC61KZ23_9EURY|nr:MAG: pyruvate kinase [ANME-2 cluster archaeon]
MESGLLHCTTMTIRRTKIVCTTGPATESEESLRQLTRHGMDICRLNMSHGMHEWHARQIRVVRTLSNEQNRAVAIMLDIQGPKIRTSRVQGGSVVLRAGDDLTINSSDIIGDARHIGVRYPLFAKEVSKGQTIMIDDGRIRMVVVGTDGVCVEAKVVVGGVLTDKRGVSVPEAHFSVPSVTEKDKKDLSFGIEHNVDYIAVSFVRRASDISGVKQMIHEQGADIPVIAKIETKKGLDNFPEILKVADGIMVARGDLGVEIPIEEVPVTQKRLIAESNASGKPVITATQMLESMIHDAIPTRAEATDVANAILDGTDAIMLSGETTVGNYPIESLIMMDRIARTTESVGWRVRTEADADATELSIERSIGHAVCQLACNLNAAAIITTTYSGSTATVVSMYRPKTPIIAITPDKVTFHRLALIWGVTPLIIPVVETIDEAMDASVQSAMDAGFVKPGDRVVLTTGVPIFVSGTTNLITVRVVE